MCQPFFVGKTKNILNMKNTSANLKVTPYKWKVLANGEHPLMLRITKNRQRKYVALGISCSLELWDEKKNAPKNKHPNQLKIKSIITNKIQKYEDAEIEAMREGKRVSAAGLVEMVEHPAKNRTTLQFFNEIYQRFKLSGQIGNAKLYRFVSSSFKKFSPSRDYSFYELDYSVLTKYEVWMRSQAAGENTLSIHFRTLRALFNMAIKENIAHEKDYPFKKFKVSKFITLANRRAISKDEVRSIERLKLEAGTKLYEARQIFLFIYYGQGINFIDIAELKWRNKEQGRIFYKRRKTGKPITFALTKPLTQILNYWFPITGFDSENYIFPILDRNRHRTPIQIDNRIHKKRTETNKLFKEIGTLAGIKTPLTTYVVRHTFATTLKYGGVPTAIISEAMGHKTEDITQNYLKSFENSVIDEAVKNTL
jgi:integrase